jgi:threonine/homoserine/homoserine lactone efflux protein
MQKFIKIFFWGLGISFLGSLPLGTLNIAAMQLAIQEGYTNAIYFALGSLFVEMLYVRVSLVGIDWVRKQQKLLRALEWVTLAIVLLLAIGSFAAAMQPAAQAKNIFFTNTLHRFLLGAFMSAINPVQIPFWFGWSTVLFTKNILQPQKTQYNAYIIGIGLGTLLGNSVFIFGGKYIASKIQNSAVYINWAIGGVFAITALIQLYKLLFTKAKPL